MTIFLFINMLQTFVAPSIVFAVSFSKFTSASTVQYFHIGTLKVLLMLLKED